MYYELNVSKKEAKPGWNGKPSYRHLFATSPRSVTTKEEAKVLYQIFKEKFPEPDYQIMVTEYPEIGIIVDPNTYWRNSTK